MEKKRRRKQKPDSGLENERVLTKRDRTFKERPTNVKSFARLFPWGGRANEWDGRYRRQKATSLQEAAGDEKQRL
jgi:hypothetical protein